MFLHIGCSITVGVLAQWVFYISWCSCTVDVLSQLVFLHSGCSITVGVLAQWMFYHSWCSCTVNVLSQLVFLHSGCSITIGVLAQWVFYHSWCSCTVGVLLQLVFLHSGCSITVGVLAQWVFYHTGCSITMTACMVIYHSTSLEGDECSVIRYPVWRLRHYRENNLTVNFDEFFPALGQPIFPQGMSSDNCNFFNWQLKNKISVMLLWAWKSRHAEIFYEIIIFFSFSRRNCRGKLLLILRTKKPTGEIIFPQLVSKHA